MLSAVRASGHPSRARDEISFGPSRSLEDPLAAAFGGLHTHLVLEIKRCLGGEEGLSTLAELRRDDSIPDFLHLAGMPFNEVAHSGVIRSLLDPATAPTIAPLLLMSLVDAVFEPDAAERSAWTRCLEDAFQSEAGGTPGIAVRTEVAVGEDMDVQGRIDILVSGPGFTLAIENKTLSFEHDNQTRTYERWLHHRYRSALQAGIFLTIGGEPAVSRMFRPLSYVRLLGLLLRARRGCDAATRQEQVLLGSYIRTLAAAVVARQITILGR